MPHMSINKEAVLKLQCLCLICPGINKEAVLKLRFHISYVHQQGSSFKGPCSPKRLCASVLLFWNGSFVTYSVLICCLTVDKKWVLNLQYMHISRMHLTTWRSTPTLISVVLRPASVKYVSFRPTFPLANGYCPKCGQNSSTVSV